MPGPYATEMERVQRLGRWPAEMLTLMLHYNTMRGNYDNNRHLFNALLANDDVAKASCHPNAIMFMNLVSGANYANDETPSVLKFDHAATVAVNTARQAVQQNNKAIWIKYGEHSIVLLTGAGGRVEPLEAWAGNPHCYMFHQSVLDEPDEFGVLDETSDYVTRVHNNRPTRLEARAALQNLLSDNVGERKDAVDRLSRAGHGGFGGNHGGDDVPGIDVHVEDMVGLGAFRQRLTTRLKGVGHYRQRALENQQHGLLVCCRCQATANNLAAAAANRWRGCTHCGRNYCRNCKHQLVFGFIGTFTRTRRCDCAQNTERLY